MNEPWYHKGLKFACTGCGACCTGEPGYVWINKAEIQTLAAAVGMEIKEFERRHVRTIGIRKSLIEAANGDCVFFDAQARSCRVYDARPRQCRTWPFWQSNLAAFQAWTETAERCPGCNLGRLVPLQEILVQSGAGAGVTQGEPMKPIHILVAAALLAPAGMFPAALPGRTTASLASIRIASSGLPSRS